MTLDRTNRIGEWRGSNWIPNYPKVEFKHDLESCYITIKGRDFYIDMSGDTPGVTTWTEATCSIRNDDPTDEVELVPFQDPKKSWSAKKSLTLKERWLACQEALKDD